MAIAATSLEGAASASNASSYATGSITPTANRLVLAAVSNFRGGSGAIEIPTLTGNGLTWVQVATVQSANANLGRRVTVFRAMGASPSAGAVTIDFAGATQSNCAWSIIEFSDIDTSGTDGSGAVVQSKTASNTTGTAGTADFDAAFGDAVNNATYSALTMGGGGTDVITHEAGFTELHEVQPTGEAQRLHSMWRLAEDQTPAPTWVNSLHWAQVAIEIKAAGAGPQTLTGTLFTKAATFPTGVVSQSGIQNLTGTLFAKAPTFNVGTVVFGGATVRTHRATAAAAGVTSMTSTAFTPTADSILLCFTFGRLDAGVPTPTVTGHSLTWEIIGTAAASAGRAGWLFGARVGPSPTSGTVTVDYGTTLEIGYSIVEEAGTASGSLPDVIRLVGLDANDTLRTSFAIHQQAFVYPVNDALGFWYIGNSTTATVGSGWTELGQAAAGSICVLAQGRIGEGLVMDATWGAASHLGAIFACEVRAAGSSAFPPVRDVRWLTRGSGTAGTTITTDSITPTAEALVCVLISAGRSTGPQTPTSVVGNGITYTLAGTVDFATVATPLWRFSVWTGSAAAPTAGTVVVTFPGNQSEGRRWAIFEAEDVTSVIQIAVDADDTATALSATLGAFTHVNNPTFGLFTAFVSQTWPTPGSGFQHIVDPANNDRMSGFWRGSNDTTVDMTYATASHAAFIALELEAVPVGVSQIPDATTSNDGWATAPLAGQAIHTYIASDDFDYITVTVP